MVETMFKRALVGGIAFALTQFAVAQAASVTIDFTAPNQSITSTPYEEDGFIVNGDATSTGQVNNDELLDFFFSDGEVFSFTRADDGLFQFISVDYRSDFEGDLSDSFQLVGLFGGMQVVDFGSFATTSETFLTAAFMNAILIDELQVVAAGFNDASVIFDNFVFDVADAAVPLPAAAPLFLFAIAGLSRMKRRSL